MKLTRFASGSVRGFSKIKPAPSTSKIGQYFWANPSVSHQNRTEVSWSKLSYWWVDPEHTIHATQLPTSATHVTMVPTSLVPFVSANSWTQPKSIDAASVGIEFYSYSPIYITCNITVSAPATCIFGGYTSNNSP